MFTSTFIASLFAAAAVLAAPITAPTDVEILQFALTLEHLETAFYQGALEKYDEAAFNAAGISSLARQRYVEIAAHEKTHVDLLTSVIGPSATAACEYSFPYTDPKSFAAMSQVMEGVGVSAYAGAAKFLTDAGHLTAAASILSTEARQAAWVASSVNSDTPWSGPFDVPLDLDQVFTIASSFITSCPSTNPTLPVKAFPSLSVATPTPAPGSEITLTFESTASELFLAIFTGLDTIFVAIQDYQVTLPTTLSGTIYAVVTSSGTSVTDDNTVAGPAIMLFPDNE